jgi:hypothetical protein
MARTGTLKGYSLPQQLAGHLRRKYRLPIVENRRYSGISWENATPEVFKKLSAAVMAERMLVTGDSKPYGSYWQRHHEVFKGAVENKVPEGHTYGLSKDAKRALNGGNYGSNQELDQLLDDLEHNREQYIEMDILNG